MIHSTKLQSTAVKNLLHVLDGVFTVVSPLMLSAAICSAVIWGLERAPTSTYIQTDQMVVADAGSQVRLPSTFTTQVDARKVIYHMWLEDQQGEPVYVFPDTLVVDPVNINLSLVGTFQIPPSLKAGTYLVQVEAIYPFNPLKNGRIYITAATLVVKPQ